MKQVNTVTTYEDITVYMRHDQMGYVCDSNNKKQKEAALNWATVRGHSHSEQKMPNCGFTLSIVDSANSSYVTGGKLSFWTCYIEKDGYTPFYVGINSDVLCELLKHSTFTNGVCDTPVSFCRINGQVGVFHGKMPLYEPIKEYISQKKNITAAKKTSNYIIGHKYITQTKADVYLGYYPHVKVNISYNGEEEYVDIYFSFPTEISEPCHHLVSTELLDRDFVISHRVANLPSRVDDGEVNFDIDSIANKYYENITKRAIGRNAVINYCELRWLIENYTWQPEMVSNVLRRVEQYMKSKTERVRVIIYGKPLPETINETNVHTFDALIEYLKAYYSNNTIIEILK